MVICCVVPSTGKAPVVSWKLWKANPICLRLLVQLMRLAASRTFWTAGSKRPMRMAMIAITTSSSISVNATRFRLMIKLLGRLTDDIGQRLTARLQVERRNLGRAVLDGRVRQRGRGRTGVFALKLVGELPALVFLHVLPDVGGQPGDGDDILAGRGAGGRDPRGGDVAVEGEGAV